MSLYRRRKGGASARQLQVLGIIAVAVYVVAQFIVFQLSLTRWPATWTIGGQPYPNQPLDAAVQQASVDLQQPLTLHYYTHTLAIDPATLDFSVDMTETLRLVREARSQSSALGDFLRHLIFQPPAPRDVLVVANYSDEKVRARLAELAAGVDMLPQPPQPVTRTLTLAPGTGGYQLDIIASMQPIDLALKTIQPRELDLIIADKPAPTPTLDHLGRLLQARLAAFNGTASVFIKDLSTGAELDLNPNVAYSGMGVMKLPIVLEALRPTGVPPEADRMQGILAALRAELVTQPTNDLLALMGNGDALAATRDVTTLMRGVGLRNTYLAAPYDQPITLTQSISVTTPANSNPAVDTHATAAAQTTATDMGLLMELVYLCQRQGGTLPLIYGDQFDSTKCALVLDLLRQNSPADIPSLLSGGLPSDASVAHRPGWNNDTRGDVALTISPGGNYVIAVFLNTANQTLDWSTANSLMNDLARATYNFFNP